MIKIVSGAYGYRNEDGSITPKTSKDKPFSLPPEEELRLVRRKVAVFADGMASAMDGRPEYSVDMGIKELKELMKAVGLKPPAALKKVDAVAALDEYYDSLVEDDPEDPEDDTEDGEEENEDDGDDTDDDGEEPPDLGAEAPLT